MTEQIKEYFVVHAFTSLKGDGSGETEYFTGGNQHLLADYISPDELKYRIEKGYVTESIKDTQPPVTMFVAPSEEPVPAAVPAPVAARRTSPVSATSPSISKAEV